VPLVCLFVILPATKSLWDQWWKNFMKWIIFAPAASFFLSPGDFLDVIGACGFLRGFHVGGEEADHRGDGGIAVGVRTSLNESFYARTVVLTPGTFLNGTIHIGLTHFSGGRLGESSSVSLSDSLKSAGLAQERICKSCLPMVHMGDDCYVSYFHKNFI